jgi:hypothetical protein
MSRIKPATGGDKAAIAKAIGSLRDARTLLRKAGADRACRAATRALKSAEGGRRHVHHRIMRTLT